MRWGASVFDARIKGTTTWKLSQNLVFSLAHKLCRVDGIGYSSLFGPASSSAKNDTTTLVATDTSQGTWTPLVQNRSCSNDANQLMWEDNVM
jgi:hypothetical protein